jgi:hypothetical protein
MNQDEMNGRISRENGKNAAAFLLPGSVTAVKRH